MDVTIVGAGNGGHAMAVELAIAGHRVTLCSRDVEKIDNIRRQGGVDRHGVLGEGVVALASVTDDIGPAVAAADIVALPVPGMVQESYLEWVLPHVTTQAVWLSPGTGGSLIAAQILRRLGTHDVLLIETMTLPYAARLTGPARVGVSALINLRCAAFPSKRSSEASDLLLRLYGGVRSPEVISVSENVLDTTVNNINCIVHPQPSLMNMGWIEARQRIFSIYAEGMTPLVLKLLYAVDRERQAVAAAAGLEVIEIDELYELIGTGPIYRQSMGLGDGTERFYDRFITEDVPVGLVTLQSLGDALNVDTPLIDATIQYSNALYDTDFVSSGRTLDRLGLGGMSAEEMRGYLQEGIHD